MATKKTISLAAKAKTTPLTLHSVSEMNDLLIKASKLIEIYRTFIDPDNVTSCYEISPETSCELFKMFNKASYQDVMLFRYLLENIFLQLDDETIKTADVISDGSYYYELIDSHIKS